MGRRFEPDWGHLLKRIDPLFDIYRISDIKYKFWSFPLNGVPTKPNQNNGTDMYDDNLSILGCNVHPS